MNNTIEKIQFHARKHGFEFDVKGNNLLIAGRFLIIHLDNTVTFEMFGKAIKTYKSIYHAVKAVYNSFGTAEFRHVRRQNDIKLAEQIASQYNLPVGRIDDNELNNGDYFLHFSLKGVIRLYHVTDLISEHHDILEAVQALNNIINPKEDNTMKSENKNKLYVTMTDTFLSGWGMAENKISKYVIECDTYEEALIVQDNAKARTDMKHVSIAYSKPNYSKKRHHVSLVTKEEAGNWFIPDYFKKQLSTKEGE